MHRLYCTTNLLLNQQLYVCIIIIVFVVCLSMCECKCSLHVLIQTCSIHIRTYICVYSCKYAYILAYVHTYVCPARTVHMYTDRSYTVCILDGTCMIYNIYVQYMICICLPCTILCILYLRTYVLILLESAVKCT